MCIRSVTFFVSCIVVGIDSMAIPESFPSRWLSYLCNEITPIYHCFAGEETRKGMQCALGMLLPAAEKRTEDQESSSKERVPRHRDDEDEVEIGTEYDEEEDTDNTNKKKKKKKKGSSFKEGHRKKKHKTRVLIPAAIGIAAIIVAAIVGLVGLIAGKAFAMSFLAFVMTIALSARAVASHQRSTVEKEDIHDALIAEIGRQMLAQTDLPVDNIVYSSFRRREL